MGSIDFIDIYRLREEIDKQLRPDNLIVYVRKNAGSRFVEVENKPGPENEGSWGAWVKDTFPEGYLVLITGRGFCYAYEVIEETVHRPVTQKNVRKL